MLTGLGSGQFSSISTARRIEVAVWQADLWTMRVATRAGAPGERETDFRGWEKCFRLRLEIRAALCKIARLF